MSDSVDPDEGTVNPFAPKAEAPKAEPKSKPTRTSKALSAVKDEDTKAAPQREAESSKDDDQIEMVTLEFHGDKFKVPADQDDWPIVTVQAFSKGLAIDGIELLLGRVQWSRFIQKFPRKRQFGEFSDMIAEEFGFADAGN